MGLCARTGSGLLIGLLATVASAQTPPAAPPSAPPRAGAGPAGPAKFVSPELISRADAVKVAEASLAACERMGETVAVYVTDADGYVRVAMTSDKLNPIGLSSVALKTATVLQFKQSTRALAARVESDPAFAAQYGKDPRYWYHPGALPLFRDGKFVAVLALGGGHDKDESCALEALKLLPWAKTTS